MTNKNFWVVLITSLFVLLACTDTVPDTETQSDPVKVLLAFPSECEDPMATEKEVFCTAALPIIISMDRGDAVAPYRSERIFNRPAGGLEASVSFDNLPNDQGNSLHVNIEFDFELPSGYEIWYQSGQIFEKMHEFLPLAEGENEHLLALRIVNSNPSDGKGHVCLTVNPETDLLKCSVTVDGNAVLASNDAGNTCQGILLKDLPAKNSAFGVICGEVELGGSLSTEVVEGVVTSVTIDLEDTSDPTSGFFDVVVKNEQDTPLTDCSFDFLQLPVDPTFTSVPAECEGSDGCYRFESIKAGVYDFSVICGSLRGERSVTIVAGETQRVFITLLEDTIPSGDLCVGKLGLPMDLDTPVASLQEWVGYGVSGGCQAATDSQYAAMTITDLSGPSCLNLSDSNCAVSALGTATDPKINGEYQHLLWTVDFTNYADGEQRVFAVTVRDENQNTVVVHLDSRKDYFQ